VNREILGVRVDESRARDHPAPELRDGSFFRVPCTCPNAARWAFLAFCLLNKINKLRVFNGLWGFNSPLQHQMYPVPRDEWDAVSRECRGQSPRRSGRVLPGKMDETPGEGNHRKRASRR